MKNLFAYGTLMCDEIMHAVTRHHFSPVSAVLNGYSRKGIRGEVYPAVIPDANDCVIGVLYLSVSQVAWKKLDTYEGDMYSRDSVVVALKDGKVLPAETYVIRPPYRYLLINSGWDYGTFLRRNKKQYLYQLK